ncbi:MAG TPA: hypothetical protein VE871_17460 [Longimicrobium sp.]|nr:hypothetical protein [Longimicrobium sp.]
MNRFALSLGIAAATALAAPHAGAQAHAAPSTHGMVRLVGAWGKVTAPVEVVITALPEPGPGRRRVRITARPSVDAASLSLDVSAESGLALGDPAATAWTGPARAGEAVVREVDLAVSGPGELRLIVTATVKHGDDVVQTGIHEFAFNPAPSADALIKSFGRARAAAATDPGGRTIVEVPAKQP